MQSSTSKTLRLVLGGAFFALCVFYWFASFYIWLVPQGSNADWHGSGAFGDYRVTEVDPQKRIQRPSAWRPHHCD
jgi:hypothetical protein